MWSWEGYVREGGGLVVFDPPRPLPWLNIAEGAFCVSEQAGLNYLCLCDRIETIPEVLLIRCGSYIGFVLGLMRTARSSWSRSRDAPK